MTNPLAHVGANAGRAGACLICGVEVRFHLPAETGTDVVCESPDCRVIMSRRKQLGPHGFRFLVEKLRRQRREQQRLAERGAREALENELIRDAVSRQEPLPASRYPLLVLPAAPQRIEVLSPDRRQQYQEHLAQIVAEAVAGDENDAAPAPATSGVGDPVPLAEQLCTLCRGGCCSQGGEKAYLSAATIRRFMRLRPELPTARISAEYLDRLGDRTVAGSCINHTASGCGLPREMRSDSCNAFYCKSLRDWQASCASGAAPLGALVIQRGRDTWSQDRTDVAHDVVAVSVVTESGIRSCAK